MQSESTKSLREKESRAVEENSSALEPNQGARTVEENPAALEPNLGTRTAKENPAAPESPKSPRRERLRTKRRRAERWRGERSGFEEEATVFFLRLDRFDPRLVVGVILGTYILVSAQES